MPSHVGSNLMPHPSARQRLPVEYVVLSGIRRTATAEERGRCICFGRDRSGAVCWRSTANPIVTTCAAGLAWAAWQPFLGGWGWFHVKPMAKPPPGVLHKTLRTELSTESVTSRCRMALMD